MTPAALLNVIVSALAILGVLIGGFGYYRNDALRKDVADRNERIDFLEDKDKRNGETIKAQAEEILEMHTEIRSLKEHRDAQAGPFLEVILLIKSLIEQSAAQHELMSAHHDIARAGFGMTETQIADVLRILGDRRHTGQESVIGELGRREADDGQA